MTDNEIIKAFECCALEGGGCRNCPYNEECERGADLMILVLDLINRYKEEIAELEAEIDKQYEQAKADILGNMSDGGTSCHWCITQHRVNAIKEFVERLCDGRVSNDPVVIAAKCLVKEITEETST